MPKNSDYKNLLHNKEIQKGLSLFAFLVILPLGWFATNEFYREA
jgi:hypothetical protein